MSKTKTKTRKKFFIVLLIVLLLALAVGYAAFSDTLTISGTANTKGTFDLQFVVDNNTPANGCYVKSQVGTTASVSVGADNESGGQANDKLTVTVQNLAFPGAGADIQAVIKNYGTIPAKIKTITATPAVSNSQISNGNAIVIKGLEQITDQHPTIGPDGTCTFNFTVMWDPNVTVLDATKDGEDVTDSTNVFEFTLEIEYEQDTTGLNTTTTHTDANTV